MVAFLLQQWRLMNVDSAWEVDDDHSEDVGNSTCRCCECTLSAGKAELAKLAHWIVPTRDAGGRCTVRDYA